MNLRDWTRGIYDQHGTLTPEIVREEARPPDSPAHGFVFNVPVGEAAENYYLERAHKLIQVVRVTYRPTPDDIPRRVRVWHAVTGDEQARVYEPLDVIVGRPDMFQQALTAAQRRVLEAQSAVEDLDVIATDRRASSAALAALREAADVLSTTTD